ncbi:hypothetical protein GCM10009646_78940 [Streptomyces aureus]
MTGFKSGASGDDPLGGGNDDETDESSSADDIASAAAPIGDEQRAGDRDDQDETGGGLPWIYARDEITDDRVTVQLHLQQSSKTAESNARAEVEDELGESVKKADLREAALLVGLEHVDGVADQLREWGYDFE